MKTVVRLMLLPTTCLTEMTLDSRLLAPIYDGLDLILLSFPCSGLVYLLKDVLPGAAGQCRGKVSGLLLDPVLLRRRLRRRL